VEDIMSIKVDPDWWKTLFDEVYLLTDARSVVPTKSWIYAAATAATV
jgi:hypothetical protein